MAITVSFETAAVRVMIARSDSDCNAVKNLRNFAGNLARVTAKCAATAN